MYGLATFIFAFFAVKRAVRSEHVGGFVCCTTPTRCDLHAVGKVVGVDVCGLL